MPSPETELDLMLFELSPVSLWLEDFSGLARLFERWRAEGVSDLRSFLMADRARVAECSSRLQVLRVNRRTLEMFGAADLAPLVARMGEILRDDTHLHFIEEVAQLWAGALQYSSQTVNYTLAGERLDMSLKARVLPGHEADGSRGPLPVAVLVIDLNGLKQANDQGGHAAGGALLRRTGEVLAKAVESPNTAARIGGDEFAVLIPRGDAAVAQEMADQVQQLVELNNQFSVGDSLSLAMGPAVSLPGERLEAAVHRADALMYAQKKAFHESADHDRRCSGEPSRF